MDKNLDHIIKTITYLEWPGHDASTREKKRFWEKLVLSMPKLRPLQEQIKKQLCICDFSIHINTERIWNEMF